jgi:hypothetical protein
MLPLAARVPERSFAIALLVRAAVLWLVLRAVIGTASVIVPGQRPRGPFVLSIPASLGLVGIVGTLALLDARRRNEGRFLANLGVSEAVIVLLSMIPAAAAELLIGMIAPR